MSRSAVLTTVAVTLLGLCRSRRTGSGVIPQQSSKEGEGYDWEIEMVLRSTEPGAVGKGEVRWGAWKLRSPEHTRRHGLPQGHWKEVMKDWHNDTAYHLGKALEGRFDWGDSLEELRDEAGGPWERLGMEALIGKRLWPIPWLRRKFLIPPNSHHSVEVRYGPKEARVILRFKSLLPNLWQRHRDDAAVYAGLMHDLLSRSSADLYATKEQLTQQRLDEKIRSLLNFPGIDELFPQWQRTESGYSGSYLNRELVEVVEVTLRPEKDYRTLIGYGDTEPVRRA